MNIITWVLLVLYLMMVFWVADEVDHDYVSTIAVACSGLAFIPLGLLWWRRFKATVVQDRHLETDSDESKTKGWISFVSLIVLITTYASVITYFYVSETEIIAAKERLSATEARIEELKSNQKNESKQ